MQRQIRVWAAAAGCLAGALFVPTLVAFTPAAGAAPASVADKAGDTLTDAVEDPITAPAADIVATSVDSRSDAIILSVRTAKAADPTADGNWLSDSTSLAWELNVNGDQKSDYEIDYYVDQETKGLAADFFHYGGGHLPDECEATPSYSPDAGLTVSIDPKCLPDTTAFSYRVSFEYSTNAKDLSADVATDASPDEGWSGPVTVSRPPGVTPVTLSPPVQTIAPQQAPAGTEAPSQNAVTPTSGTQATTNARRPVQAPQPTPRPRPASAAPGIATAPAPGLAQTGPSAPVGRLAGFAVGIAFMGAGLLFATRRPSLP